MCGGGSVWACVLVCVVCGKGASMADHPRTLEEIFEDCSARREGLMRAITKGEGSRETEGKRERRGLTLNGRNALRSVREDGDKLYEACDPEKENLCLYGHPDGTWEVGLPAEEVSETHGSVPNRRTCTKDTTQAEK